MARVVATLSVLPDVDIRAMAVYLAPGGTVDEAAAAQAAEAHAGSMTLDGIEARLYAGACASCHEAGELVSLALNTNLYNARPDNVIQGVLRGVAVLTDMPSFADSLTDAQVAELAAHLRARFVPEQPAWSNLERIAGAVRKTTAH